MTEQELRDAIGNGRVDNRIQDFWAEAIRQMGKKNRCPAVYKVAWRMYVESVKDIKTPTPFGFSEEEKSVIRAGLGVPFSEAVNPSDYPPFRRGRSV